MSDLLHAIIQADYDVRNSRNQQGLMRKVGIRKQSVAFLVG
jgi:hypothetical protein